jgi:hypothetical protein
MVTCDVEEVDAQTAAAAPVDGTEEADSKAAAEEGGSRVDCDCDADVWGEEDALTSVMRASACVSVPASTSILTVCCSMLRSRLCGRDSARALYARGRRSFVRVWVNSAR